MGGSSVPRGAGSLPCLQKAKPSAPRSTLTRRYPGCLQAHPSGVASFPFAWTALFLHHPRLLLICCSSPVALFRFVSGPLKLEGLEQVLSPWWASNRASGGNPGAGGLKVSFQDCSEHLSLLGEDWGI